MPRYAYEAFSATGSKTKGAMDAASRNELVSRLREMGYFPTHVEEAVGEALQRLQAGEEEIAFHPNCGTNLTTSIFLITAAALIGSAGNRRTFLERVTITTGMVTLAVLVAGPLGMRLQRVTTSAAVDGLSLANIAPVRDAHRITFNR